MASLGPGTNTGSNTLSMQDALMRNRRPRPSSELDVWFQPSSRVPSPQPHFSFPVSSHTPIYSASTDNSLFFDAKSSPTVVTDSSSTFTPPRGSPRVGLGLNWRESSLDAARRHREDQVAARQRKYIVVGGALLVVTIVLLVLKGGSKQEPVRSRKREYQRTQAQSMSTFAPLFSSAAKRPDVASFRDELSTDMAYVTSPQHGDFHEQIMNFYHLTHLASVMSRIPLVQPFALPASDADNAPMSVPFSSIFDMPRFTSQTNVYAIDWNDIRPSNAGNHDKLGCWIGSVNDVEQIRQRSLTMKDNGVDASFFPLRASAVHADVASGDQVLVAHNFLAGFEKDTSAQAGLIEQAKHVSTVTTLTASTHTDPENHVLCFDHTLYRPEHPTTSHTTTHLDPRDHTAFHTHGKALHYLPELQDAALDVVSFVLGNKAPFIAVHIDAKAQAAECALRHQDAHAEADCAVPKLNTYVQAIERVRILAARGGSKKQSREQRVQARASSVLVTTDVTDLAFKGEIAGAGWTLLDFDDLELKQRLGQWPSAVIEGVVHSKAAAFVGTRGSSLSTLSALRVREWRSGPTELVF